MSKKPRDIISHFDRHDCNRAVSIEEIDGDFNFRVGNDVVGSIVFRTPKRDSGVTPEAVIAAVEDHLQSFDPSRGETHLAVSHLEQARHFLAAGRDFAKIAKREFGEGKDVAVAAVPSPAPPAPAKQPEAVDKKSKPSSHKEK